MSSESPSLTDSGAAPIPTKRRRGFAAMSPEKRRWIASLGGRTAHAYGCAHRFTKEEAREAGRRGGQVVSEDRTHMAELGRRGGKQRSRNLAAKRSEPAGPALELPLVLPSPSLPLILTLLLLLVSGFPFPAVAQPMPSGDMTSFRAADNPLFWPVPLSLSPQCHFIGDCAQFDAIALKAGTTLALRGNGDPHFAGISGLVHASISFLDLVDLGAAVGGYITHDEAGAFHVATMPASVHAKLRLLPLFWKRLSQHGDPQIAVSYQRSFFTDKLGADEPPGFGTNTVRVLASRSVGPVDVDVGVGGIWGDGPQNLRRAVELQATAALLLFGLAKALTPDEQLRLMVQTLYRFSLPGDNLPSDAYVLAGVEQQTYSGYRFGIAGGPYLLGSRVGGMGMLTFSVAWGQRYRNPLAEYIASRPPWIPKALMDLFYVDPVLDADGCIRTDPFRFRIVLKCVGHPDPNDPKTIILDDGRRLPVNTHLWILPDGKLITQHQEEIAQLDRATAERAIAFQQLLSWIRAGDKEKPCKLPRSILNDDLPNLHGFLAFLGSAEIEVGRRGLEMNDFLAALEACGLGHAIESGSLLPPVGLKGTKGSPTHLPTFSGKGSQAGEAEHLQPAVQPPKHKSQFLANNDAKGGHIVDRHVEKTDQEMVERLWTDKQAKAVSTFTDEVIAEMVIKETLEQNSKTIAGWLKDPSKDRLTLNYTSDKVIGRGIREGEFDVSNKTNARIVLIKDDQGGYYVLTAFPE